MTASSGSASTVLRNAAAASRCNPALAYVIRRFLTTWMSRASNAIEHISRLGFVERPKNLRQRKWRELRSIALIAV